MADEPAGAGPPPYDPLPGWPAAPEEARRPSAMRPPSAPPPGWAASSSPPDPQPKGTGGGPGRRGLLRSRRVLVVVGVVVVLLVAVAATVAVVSSGGGGDGAATKATSIPAPAPGGSGTGTTQPSGPGKEVTLLEGRVTVAARPGWEPLESSAETATLKLFLREATGRELLSTFIIADLPGAGSLDNTLSLRDGTGFAVPTPVGPLRATAMPGASARIVAGITRPRGTLFLSLSIFAVDGKGLDVPLLKKLFTEQVVPALRFA